MTTITVTNLNDSGTGSLRQAMLDANSGDTITFDPSLAGGTLTLTSGELDITKNLTIDGFTNANGTPDLTISGNNASRVFEESGFGTSATLDGLVITNGSANAGSGGGIATNGPNNLILKNCQVTNNQASSSGGGIYGAPGGEVVLFNSSLSGNTSDGAGGGIYGLQLVTLIDSTASGNYSKTTGGAIGLGRDASGTFTNATLVGNKSGGNGGAIYGHTSLIRLYDSTVTGNYAGGAGGGIYNLIGFVGLAREILSNSIVAGNAAAGSGPDLDLDGSPLYLHGNNILGSAPANANPIDTTYGTYTQIDGSNQAALETVFAQVANNPDTGVLSGVLADIGGPVDTVGITPVGIAYNGGSNSALRPDALDLNNNGNTTEPLPVDARGYARVVGGTVDIGAVEQQFVVTTLADNPYDGGTLAQELAEGNGLSLRQALGLAAKYGGSDTITFASSLTGHTITLTNGELDIASDVTIYGGAGGYGNSGIVAIDAGGASRVFNIDSGSPSPVAATLEGLVITGGSSGSAGPADDGGGIAVGQSDSLVLKDSKVINNQGYAGGGIYGAQGSTITLIGTGVFDNSSATNGGGIDVGANGVLTLANTTLSDNDSQGAGGGIDLGSNATGTLTNATLAGNSSGTNGGGIYGEGSNVIQLFNSTLTGNYATGSGGGIDSAGGANASLTLANTIVAGNAVAGSGTDLYLGNSPLVLKGDNILGSTPANASTIDKTNGTYAQVDGASESALLRVFSRVAPNPDTNVLSGVLADNGGPVRTVAITPGGMAYNAGSNTALPPDSLDLNNNGNTTEPLPVDARGFARVVGGTVDIGAFEQQQGVNLVVTTLADNPYDGGTLAQELAEGHGLSLRQALGLANQDPTSADLITFDPSLVGGSTHGVNDGALLLTNGALTVNGDVTIEGDINGDTKPDITINGQGNSQDFVITGGNVALDGLTITGGYNYANGGGVSIQAAGYGSAEVTISHSAVTNNYAGFGGGISVDAGDFLLLANSTVSGNKALYVGGGIAGQGGAELLNSTVSGNSAGFIGGGIANAGSLEIFNSTLSNNRINHALPGLAYDSAGGGLYNSGDASLVNTTISGNKGSYAGGGVYNSGGLLLTNATIANNSAYNGGGLYNAACGCGNATVYDSTFTGNYANRFGGGIDNANGTVTLTNTLDAGNGAGFHGKDIQTGLGTSYYAGVNLFSQANAGRLGIDIVQPDLSQVFPTLTTIDPDGVPNSGDEFQAGTLANNGGPVQTVAIKRRGSAQNTGDTGALPPDVFDLNNNGNTSEPLPFDARNAPRVFGSAVDIGAFEAQAPVPNNDVNGDGKSDVLWQNVDGLPAIWEMNGTSLGSAAVLPNPGASWHVEASGQFTTDGKADIVLQNSDGLPEIWLMNGTSVTSTVTLPDPGPTWHTIATGTFFGGGQADILWQNDDGLPAIWQMNGTSIQSGAVITIGVKQADPGPSWHAIGAGDFNGDGKSDILWQNNDGLAAIWEMNGTSIDSFAVLPNPGPTWHAIGVGDFNGDGDADILWQNSDGAPAIWEMNGMSIIGAAVLPNPGTSWHAIGTSDFNGDLDADILWQNSDGVPAIWEMNGTSILTAAVLPNPGSTWHPKDDGPITSGAGSPQAALHLSSPDTANAVLNTSAPPQIAATSSSLVGNSTDQTPIRQLFSTGV